MSQYFFRYYPSPIDQEQEKLEKRIFWFSQIIPFLVVLAMWLMFLFENVVQVDFRVLGIYPMKLSSLTGIITMPFVHGDIKHIISNTIPFYVLATAVFFFYRKLAPSILISIWIISGILLWFSGREAWHIGMSGVVYGLASFLFFSGILRADRRLLTISLAVAFLYGSMIWGVFPIKPSISWEGHLSGAVTGLALAAYYRKLGPPRTKYEWELEDDENNDDENEDDINIETSTRIKYD